jgi:hypothetical protein
MTRHWKNLSGSLALTVVRRDFVSQHKGGVARLRVNDGFRVTVTLGIFLLSFPEVG